MRLLLFSVRLPYKIHRTMNNVTYILSKSQQQRKVNSSQSMIMLRYSFAKQTVLFSPYKSIDQNHWDTTHHCAKNRTLIIKRLMRICNYSNKRLLILFINVFCVMKRLFLNM